MVVIRSAYVKISFEQVTSYMQIEDRLSLCLFVSACVIIFFFFFLNFPS